MSEPSSPAPSPEVHPAPAPVSFLQRYRLHLAGAGVLLLVVFFLLIGIAIGMAKKNFEKKFYLTQIEKLKDSLAQAVDHREEMQKEITDLKIDLRAKKDHVSELDEKIEKLEAKLKKSGGEVEPATSTHGANVASTAAVASSGDQGVDYVRLKAGDCVVDSGAAANTASKWRECLKNAKKTPETKH
ncbi:hypothetical protein HQ393_16430 [Chitinibacter bivalviorum]|uniref:Uncharacterized protein n=1 Tax=Chitinibacter bivalviorum TaxID=2739434 RepID=A0A7H9BR47_9NEIS|nr:hypothetical protein [Chitinibacter bivalviorum]QLG89704.1 hypothetical protein HQ393_16430 [Chitinibacter bivalviorum]